MITEDYVSFETAKALKMKGFREWCSMCHSPSRYYKGDIIDGDEESELKASGKWDETKATWIHTLYPFNCNNEQSEGIYAAPTLQMAMKWLREVHNLGVFPSWSQVFGCYGCRLYYLKKGSQELYSLGAHYDTYEEACEAGIKYCLENSI